MLRSDCVVVCVSKTWVRSKICNREFRMICRLRLPIVIVLIDEVAKCSWRRIAKIAMTGTKTVDTNTFSSLTEGLRAIGSSVEALLRQTSNIHPPPFNAGSLPPPPPTVLIPAPPPPTPYLPGIATIIQLTSPSLALSSQHPSSYTSWKIHPHVLHHRLAVLHAAHLMRAPKSHTRRLAIHHFYQAARYGNSDAMYRLGYIYQRGKGVEKDSIIAKRWYQAAISRIAEANFTVDPALAVGSLTPPTGVEPLPKTFGAVDRVSLSCGHADAAMALATLNYRNRAAEGSREVDDNILTLYTAAALLFSVPAMFKLGVIYFDRWMSPNKQSDGDGAGSDDLPPHESNLWLAHLWWRRAALMGGDPIAMFNLGALHEKGRIPLGYGTKDSTTTESKGKPELTGAAAWYGLCVEHSRDMSATGEDLPSTAINASFNLGVFKEKGWGGLPINLEEAVALYKDAAERGHKRAQFNYGVCLKRGRGCKKSLEDAVRWFKKAADQGHPDAQFNLGNSYKYGEGVEKNLKEAVRWYTRASDQKHPKALFNVGLCYDEGEGVEPNPAEAARYYRLAADIGNPTGQFYLGMAMERGRGVPRDIEKAAQMYKLAADQGDPDAAAALAHCYITGDGVPANLGMALKYLREAAERGGDPEAQYTLGALLFKSVDSGVSNDAAKDEEEACLWLRRGAKQGHRPSIALLVDCYNKGRGVKQDREKAAKWLEAAKKIRLEPHCEA
ncbi:hypothetical protein DFJ73DRAFT_32542 [Zopfochytrium polystomum]|nr:hypothetical protein DFJ73DRAFT_32542 [Zopfochytrium polystomum]